MEEKDAEKKQKFLVDISDDKIRIHEDQTVKKDPNKERLVECAHCGAFTSSFLKYCPHCGSLLRRGNDDTGLYKMRFCSLF